MRSCRKNRSEVVNATTSAGGEGATACPRRSDEKQTADALKADQSHVAALKRMTLGGA